MYQPSKFISNFVIANGCYNVLHRVDVIIRKHFSHDPIGGNPPVTSGTPLTKSQSCGASMFPLMLTWKSVEQTLDLLIVWDAVKLTVNFSLHKPLWGIRYIPWFLCIKLVQYTHTSTCTQTSIMYNYYSVVNMSQGILLAPCKFLIEEDQARIWE